MSYYVYNNGKLFFLIIPDLVIKSHTTSTSEIKISKYITTLIKDNSKLTKLQSLYMRSEYPLPHCCLTQPSTRGSFDL